MEQWLVIVICFAICVGTISIIEAIKQIVKYNAKKNGKTLSMKNAEYPVAILTAALNFGAVFAFLYFGKFLAITFDEMLEVCGVFAAATQTIYLFIVQSSRKGLAWTCNAISSLVNRAKSTGSVIDVVNGVNSDMDSMNEVEKAAKNSKQLKKEAKTEVDAFFEKIVK